MEHSLVLCRIPGSPLPWIVLCCLVTVVRSDRVMWVDTKGEDGPQCIHHTPVGALMAQPPPSRSCRSLQYALQSTLNSTSVGVMSYNFQISEWSIHSSHKPCANGGRMHMQPTSQAMPYMHVTLCQALHMLIVFRVINCMCLK